MPFKEGRFATAQALRVGAWKAPFLVHSAASSTRIASRNALSFAMAASFFPGASTTREVQRGVVNMAASE